MADTRSSRLTVGTCTTWAEPAKATMPTFTCRGSCSRKALAAFCAATRRLGCTSVARMLPDTSMASMMVSCVIGRLTTAKGRAAASSSRVMASNSSSGGICRRSVRPGPMASLMMDRLAKRSASFLRRRSSQKYKATNRGTASSSHSRSGQKNVMGN